MQGRNLKDQQNTMNTSKDPSQRCRLPLNVADYDKKQNNTSLLGRNWMLNTQFCTVFTTRAFIKVFAGAVEIEAWHR